MAKPTLEDIISDLADLALEKYTPPEGSFSSADYLEMLRKKVPTASPDMARRQLNALVLEGKLKKTDQMYIVGDGARAWYYIPTKGGDSKE